MKCWASHLPSTPHHIFDPSLFLAGTKEVSVNDVIATTTAVTVFDPESTLGTQRTFARVVEALEAFKASHIKQLRATRDGTKRLDEVKHFFNFLFITKFLFQGLDHTKSVDGRRWCCNDVYSRRR
jgi:hypothetical protein